MNLIHQDFADKKEVMTQEIVEKIQMRYKFSLTYDEYTSLRNRRYIGVNLHEREGKKTYKIGFIRFFGSCPAESLMQNIKVHLNSLGVCMERDIVGSTQDGAAINKKLMQRTLLISFALIMQFILVYATRYTRKIMSQTYQLLSRKVVKFIKMSSVCNQIFQKKVPEEFSKEIELRLDVRHCWNSIFSMTEPLLKAKKCCSRHLLN